MAPKDPTTARHSRKSTGQGWIRLEVARESDRPLLREVARKLRDPSGAVDLRAGLQTLLGNRSKLSKKAVLAAAPLEGIDLTRDPDPGRDIDF